MANTLLSPSIITREALRILHAKLNFIANCDKQYDKQFANGGASPSGKIGPTLTIRMPNKYTVRTGSTLAVQDTTEASQTLTVATQKGVDMNFTSADLTLTLDEYSQRYLEPAISVLATTMENDALSMIKDVYNAVDDNAAAFSYKDFANGRKSLNQYLAPDTGRVGILHSDHVVSFLDAIKGNFNPQESVAKPYLTGKIGRVQGLDTYENTVLNKFQTGTAASTTLYTVNGATQSGATITVQTGTTTFLKGDIVTFAGANAVDPETKADRGFLQKFVITADSGASAVSLSISPSLVTSGAGQNVTGFPTNGGNVLKVGGSTSALYAQSLVFHPEAFAFVTADLINPNEMGSWGARRVMDGISMRIVRQYDITNDKMPCRIDVLYGFKTIRPELACRIIAT